MLIGQLAEKSGLSRDTIRFYEKEAFIQAITRNNGYKDYPEQTLQQLELIKTAKALGFSLAEIKQVSLLLAQGAVPGTRVQQALQDKIAMIDEKLAKLQDMRQLLMSAAQGADCPLQQDCELPALLPSLLVRQK